MQSGCYAIIPPRQSLPPTAPASTRLRLPPACLPCCSARSEFARASRASPLRLSPSSLRRAALGLGRVSLFSIDGGYHDRNASTPRFLPWSPRSSLRGSSGPALTLTRSADATSAEESGRRPSQTYCQAPDASSTSRRHPPPRRRARARRRAIQPRAEAWSLICHGNVSRAVRTGGRTEAIAMVLAMATQNRISRKV